MERIEISPKVLDNPLSVSSETIINHGLLTTFTYQLAETPPTELIVQITPDVKEEVIYIGQGERNIGVIKGFLLCDKDRKMEFMTTHTQNFARFSQPHIRGAVGGTIAYLVDSGIIYRWYSDTNLSEDAKKMYATHLAADERLLVYAPSDETGNRYIVMRKS